MAYFKVDVQKDGGAVMLTLNACGDVLFRRELGKVLELVDELQADFLGQLTGEIHCDVMPALAIAARVAGVDLTGMQTIAFDREERRIREEQRKC